MAKENTFEESYKRLEEILEQINLGRVSLEDSIILYEEANKLITSCSKKIDLAEKKITTLMRNRDKELILDENGKPLERDFVYEGKNSIE